MLMKTNRPCSPVPGPQQILKEIQNKYPSPKMAQILKRCSF